MTITQAMVELDPSFRAMPYDIKQYNACTDPCDMLVGPCACGSWHRWDDWPKKMRQFILAKDNDTLNQKAKECIRQ